MGSLGYYAGILKDFGLPRTLKLAKNIFYVPGNKDNKFSIGYISLSNICPNNCRDCYVKKGNNILDIEIADKYIKILHDQGVRTFVFVGGEPLLYNSKNNMFNLIGKHPKDTFHICTSTTGLTKYDSIKASQYKNIVFVLSIDGLEENNDIRRGDKSFEKTINAARILRNNKNPLGVYTTINSLNYKEISSEKYIDFLISEGFKFISFHRHFSIKDAYSLDQLKAKKIAVIVNLEPAVLRGEKSNGMLLASEQGILAIPAESKTKPGTLLTKECKEIIKFDDFKKHVLVVKDSFVHLDGTKLPLKMDKSVPEGTKVM